MLRVSFQATIYTHKAHIVISKLFVHLPTKYQLRYHEFFKTHANLNFDEMLLKFLVKSLTILMCVEYLNLNYQIKTALK